VSISSTPRPWNEANTILRTSGTIQRSTRYNFPKEFNSEEHLCQYLKYRVIFHVAQNNQTEMDVMRTIHAFCWQQRKAKPKSISFWYWYAVGIRTSKSIHEGLQENMSGHKFKEIMWNWLEYTQTSVNTCSMYIPPFPSSEPVPSSTPKYH
jgi:hypothetical protein